MSQQPNVYPSPCPSLRDVQIMNTKFPAGAPPHTHPNTNPHCNRLALCPPGLPTAISPLNRDAWNFHLTDYPDREFVNAILNIIDVGASIGHVGLLKSQSCRNLRSALDHSPVISNEIHALLAEG